MSGQHGAMVTLAHLSDPHLGPLPTVDWAELIGKRLTGYINWQQKRRFIHDPAVLARIVTDLKALRPDHIAATGDFANIGLPAEFEHARDFLAELGPAQDVTAVPGNHDAYVSGSLQAMQRICAAFMSGDDHSRDFPLMRRRKCLALIALSSGVPTAPFMATGRLGETQLGRLGMLLEDSKREGLFRVVLIHHPPVSAEAEHKRLIDGPALLRVVAEHGAELLVHGHDHVHALNWLEGPNGRVPAVGVPSASARSRPVKDIAAYNFYRIGGEPGAWRCEMESRGIVANGEVATLKRLPLYV
jgi:3',5'-cyclic AMP phosphodiesterase CpdA